MWLIAVLLTFVLSMALSMYAMPKVVAVAKKYSIYDRKDERKSHKGLIPRLGGVLFVPITFFCSCLVWGIFSRYGSFELDEYAVNFTEIVFCSCALVLIYSIGLIDDLLGMSSRLKFVAQLAAAFMITLAGYSMVSGYGVAGIYEVSDLIYIPASLLVVLLVLNAINLIDGLDGLASGLSAIAMGYYSFALFEEKAYLFVMVSMAVLGVLLAFMYFNLWGERSGNKIFMGDTGALSLGLIICILGFRLFHHPEIGSRFDFNPIVLSFSPVFLPCLDVVRVFFLRLRKGLSPFNPDRSHIHHLLLDAGLTARITLVVLLTIQVLLIAINLLLSVWININLLLVLDLILWFAFSYEVKKRAMARGK